MSTMFARLLGLIVPPAQVRPRLGPTLPIGPPITEFVRDGFSAIPRMEIILLLGLVVLARV